MDWAGVWLLEQRLVSREPGRRRGAERRWPPSPRPPRRSRGGRRPGGRVRPSEVVASDRVGRPGRGGIVWRHGEGGGVEIVLVHRLGYDDWSFPKGKLHPGETEAQAALREVQEETGLRCRLGREVGTSAYRDPKRRPKTVRYWEMTPTAGTFGAANEIDDARWVPLQEARMLLTYERDRRLLDGWHPAG
jgi:8-oxo-dGTP pyrophosphatase MutT (NUDIX family)